ncbi:choline-phosphate cytidylyltransferase [Pancytospora epiphaga]|nr:choline-phosphate cytidylyltransferase [Pancytospora epiphaga]
MKDSIPQAKTSTSDEDSEYDHSYVYLYPRYSDNDTFEYGSYDSCKKYKIPTDRPVRIYCDGVYDLFHFGHSRQLNQAKNLFPNTYLIVGIHSDSETRKNKGITVLRENERYESVKHCKYVDEIIEGSPWLITEDFLEKHGIDYVAHDDLPYQYKESADGDLYLHLKQIGRFVPTRRTKDISTTELITRILQDKSLYLQRQLERGVVVDDLETEKKSSEDIGNRLNDNSHSHIEP